jgi:hypothetical protein
MKRSDETPPGGTSKDEAGGRETPSGGPEASSFYDLVGGEASLARLVDRFYEIMDSEPAAAGIRAIHRGGLAPIRERLFAFLSGWLGGTRPYTAASSAHTGDFTAVR